MNEVFEHEDLTESSPSGLEISDNLMGKLKVFFQSSVF